MAWARIDDGFHDHPKVDDLSLAAVGLWTLCLSHAHRHRRTAVVQGHISEARVKKLAGKQAAALAAELVAAGLWEIGESIGGYVIHDFKDYLPKERDPDERREAGRKGAANRWHSDSNLPPDDVASDSSRASAPASPSRPVPSDVTQRGGERDVPLRTVADSEPNCSKHPLGDSDEPCAGCARVRAWRDKNETSAAEQRRKARESCPRCNGSGWIEDQDGNPVSKCDHRRTA